MPDTFAITIVSIVIFTVISAFIKGRSRDACLMDFSGNPVTLQDLSGKAIWGRLTVEHTGLELNYADKYKDKKGHYEMSYILYREEYPNLQALILFPDQLDDCAKNKREKELERTYHPNSFRRAKRRVRNFFKTVKDSLMDIVNMVIGQFRTMPGAGKMLASQDKYVSRMKQEVFGQMGTSYEPLLERHIGKKVILELKKGEKIFEYPCVLKEYTPDFIEIMEVDYRLKEDQEARRADLVVPRAYGVIRHLGE